MPLYPPPFSGVLAESQVTNLIADLAARVNVRGTWATSTAYAVNDLVKRWSRAWKSP